MKDIKDIMPFLHIFASLISSGLILYFALSIKDLLGRGWLVASATITLLTRPTFLILSLIAKGSKNAKSIYEWYDISNVFIWVGISCFAFFLFLHWSKYRVKIDAKALFFSYAGRTPRSVFWFFSGIIFPLGLIIGYAPFTTRSEGLVRILLWILFGVWNLGSLWISTAIYAKRWHDCGKSGWMSLVLLIPVVGVFWFYGVCGFSRGNSGSNTYGDDPLL